jgi:hypothetical protein
VTAASASVVSGRLASYQPAPGSRQPSRQPFPSKKNKKDDLIVNEDGSVDFYLGPKPPDGKEGSWVETVQGKGWLVLIRLYGPLDLWLDKTWRPGEFEPID